MSMDDEQPTEPDPDSSADPLAGDEAHRQARLDALRISRVVRERQAATRAGSYWLVAAWACILMSLDLLWRTPGEAHPTLTSAINLAAAALMAIVASYSWRRATALRRQGRARPLPPPPSPPDFSSLSDGSQIVKNLEDMNSKH
jgi:hypothetical protein